MTWPVSQDFNEAVQNPRLNFQDPELMRGVPELSRLGLPVPRSGNFADVYQIHCPDTGVDWAVKCFTRKVLDQQNRYREISNYLRQVSLPFTIGFDYLPDGIRIRGQWFPIMKMQWVQGPTLNSYVRDNLQKSTTLESLAQLWVELAQRLRDARLAHADLQHGNVLLVSDGKLGFKLKLIDYDGMFVPALAGQQSGEVGHPAYQHPLRLKYGIYNAEVDRFPHLVIGCALRALAVGGQPLWDRYDNGDNLLFRQKDFEAPHDSALLRELWQSPDALTKFLVGHLIRATSLPLGQEPFLPDLLRAGQRPVLSAADEQSITAILNRSGTRQPATSHPTPNRSRALPIGVHIQQAASLPPIVTAATPSFRNLATASAAPTASALSPSGPRGQKGLLYAGTAIAAFVLLVAFIASMGNTGSGTPPRTQQQYPPAVPKPETIPKPVNLPPIVTDVSLSPVSPQSGDTITIRFDIRDPEGDRVELREYKTNRDERWRTMLSNEIVLVDQPEGLLQVSIRVRDSTGNFSEVKVASVQVLPKPNLPPVVTIARISPESPETGDTVVIRVEVRDPEGDRIELREYKTNRDERWRTVSGNEIVLVGQDEGLLQVSIRAIDSEGKLSQVKIATIRIDPPRWSSAIAETAIKAHRLGVSAISFDADGERFATAGDDSVVKLWSPDHTTVWEIKTRAKCLAFEPKGNRLATGGADQKLHLWRLSDGGPVAELDGPKDWIRTLAFSPLGNSVAVGSDDGLVYIWELAAQRTLQSPNLKFKSIHSVAFDPRGQVLATAGSAGSGSGLLVATRYEPGIGAIEQGLQRHTESDLISSVAFSADGKWIATGAWNGFVRIRHLEDMSVQQSLGPVGQVNSIQFSPNGQLLAAGVANGSNGAVRIWSTKTWREVNAQTTAPAAVTSIAFDKVGNRLIAGCSDGVVRIWRKRN